MRECILSLFVRAAALTNQSLEKKLTAFQTSMVPETFTKASSLRLQKPIAEQTDFNGFLQIIKELIE